MISANARTRLASGIRATCTAERARKCANAQGQGLPDRGGEVEANPSQRSPRSCLLHVPRRSVCMRACAQRVWSACINVFDMFAGLARLAQPWCAAIARPTRHLVFVPSLHRRNSTTTFVRPWGNTWMTAANKRLPGWRRIGRQGQAGLFLHSIHHTSKNRRLRRFA